MGFKAIVTLGSSILDNDKLKRIDSLGECIYRINGAHASADQTEKIISLVRETLPGADIMIDLPGNKIRTANLSEPIRLIKGESFYLHEYEVNFPDFHRHIKKGDIILANDSVYTLEVVDIEEGKATILSHSDGLLYTNKGLHVKGVTGNMPFLFDKDKELIDTALKQSVDFISLSFVRKAEDVLTVKNIFKGSAVRIIAKIETLSAIDNIDSILEAADSILVDRGDLSTEIGVLKLASAQERMVEAAKECKKNVFLATQFLKNMETSPVPLISEVIDLCKTIKSGIAGIQLSEETAIGRYPVECVKLLFDAFKMHK